MKAGFWLILGAVLSSVACGGQVRMSRLRPGALDGGKEVTGVIVYQPMLVKLTHSFTVRVDKEGQLIGTSADRTCVQTVQKEELSTIADFSHPMRVRNASGPLSAAKFSVTLANGMVASVNAEPTQKFSDVLSATAAIVTAVGTLAVPSSAACNSGPVLSVARVSVP